MTVTVNSVFPAFDALSGDYANGESNGSFGSITSTNEVWSVITGNAELTVPSFEIGAHAEVAIQANGLDKTWGSYSIFGYTGARAELTVPSVSISITASIVNLGEANLTVPKISLNGNVVIGSSSYANITVPRGYILEAFGGATAIGLRVPSFTIEASATQVTIGEANLLVPGFSLLGEATVSGLSSAELIVPSVGMLSGIFRGVVSSFSLSAQGVFTPIVVNDAYAMNTVNNGLSMYQDYPFVNIIRVGDKAYGVDGTTLYLLGGDSDNTVDIDANFETHPTDFNKLETKNVSYIYLQARTAGSFEVGTVADEVYRTGGVVLDLGNTDVYNYRVKFARGVKATHWGFTVSNILGSDFQIQALQETPFVNRRKV